MIDPRAKAADWSRESREPAAAATACSARMSSGGSASSVAADPGGAEASTFPSSGRDSSPRAWGMGIIELSA